MSTNTKNTHYIHLPTPYRRTIGGPYTFLRNLIHTFSNAKATKNPLKAKALLFPVTYSAAWIWYYKKIGVPVIQRLDGLHYPEKHGESYALRNKNMADIYLNKATHIIFQSIHSKQQFLSILGQSPAQELAIIPNGARENLFHPNKNHTKQKNILNLISTGNFRGEDMLQPMLDTLDIFIKKHPNIQITLTLIGALSVDEKTKKRLHQTPYVTFLGKQSLPFIAQELKKADAFLFTHLNPPCPNSVVEALATGLPVLSFNSGAMGELCAHQKELLADVSTQNFFHTIKNFNPELLAEKISFLEKNYTAFKTQAISHAHLFTMQRCTDAYEKALRHAYHSTKKDAFYFKRLCFLFPTLLLYTYEIALKTVKKVAK